MNETIPRTYDGPSTQELLDNCPNTQSREIEDDSVRIQNGQLVRKDRSCRTSQRSQPARSLEAEEPRGKQLPKGFRIQESTVWSRRRNGTGREDGGRAASCPSVAVFPAANR
ncbi:unnamed protein product [Heligmosomoides polygyrus]|uniref:Uncharacterized protein n=1 Tax=Heligmosomoides polygyrus TaxID=6339 RepID=A0A183FTU3_HELPZ|nr:unnamed protein product [Heligmosomoides polygyrus]